MKNGSRDEPRPADPGQGLLPYPSGKGLAVGFWCWYRLVLKPKPSAGRGGGAADRGGAVAVGRRGRLCRAGVTVSVTRASASGSSASCSSSAVGRQLGNAVGLSCWRYGMGVGGLRLAAVVVAAEATEGGVCRWADLLESGVECAGALSEVSWRLAE
jgi:hypothetical protein